MLRKVHLCLLAAMALTARTPAEDDPLARGFRDPPPDARPLVYWAWMNGNISRKGITADFEAMDRIGIGGGLHFDLTVGIPPGPVAHMSPEWRALVTHAAREAARLHLEFSVHNGAGWSTTGGPWNTVEHSMQVLTMSETTVRGPASFRGELPRPKAQQDFYRDIATVACKYPVDDLPLPTLRAAGAAIESARLTDGNWTTLAELPLPGPDKPQILDLVYAEPVRARTLFLVTGPGRNNHSGEIQYSTDGKTYQTLRTFRIWEYGGNNLRNQYSFPPVQARHFRVVFTKPGPKAKKITLAEIGLYPDVRLDNVTGKGGFTLNPDRVAPAHDTTPSGLNAGDVVDLTASVNGGVLTWEVPPGTWTLLRVGHTSTGTKNHPAPAAGTGLESDKLSKTALEKHWAGMMDAIIADAGDDAGAKGLTGIFSDSWEVGYQNWTPGFLDEFRKRRGYDPLPYFPVFTGRVIGNPSISDRFLWDWRRTVSDLFAENFFGHQKTLAARHGMKFYCEPYGTNFDYMQCGGQSDMPIGEAWLGRPDAHRYTIKMAASTAHTYGIKQAGAEMFTTRDDFGKWSNHPFTLKAFGDLKMCEGINRFILHTSAHQPWTGHVPGMTYGECGAHFVRTNTWWEQARAWVDYLKRSQFLLQEGQFAGDVLWFTGESTPNIPPLRGDMQPALPDGYDFSHCDAHALVSRATVRDGRITFPDGTAYRYLLIGDSGEMSLPVARKVRELVLGGATVIGARPRRTPGLEDYPAADAELEVIANELWGDAAAGSNRTAGKGRVLRGQSFGEIFAADGLPPDFAYTGDARLNYIHRRAGNAEIYFVAHEGNATAGAAATFRVSGRNPEFWHPDTGAIEPCPVWREAGGRTEIPLRFDPAGSVFVVFRTPASAEHLVSAGPDDPQAFVLSAAPDGKVRVTAFKPCRVEAVKASGRKAGAVVGQVPAPVELTGPWEVEFEPGRGAPARATLDKLIPWNEHSDPGIRYFSGHAVYRKTFTAPDGWFGEDRSVFLDLGAVQVIAEVKLNGKDLGILWKPPFRIDTTGALRPGNNDLEIRVVNLWVNRLIGDEQFPSDADFPETTGWLKGWPQWFLDGTPRPEPRRLTFTTFKHYTKDARLQPSGLLGPVRAVAAVHQPLE